MSLEIKWDRSKRWYGRLERDGKRFSIPMEVFIEGTPPSTRKLRDKGDEAFEHSRARAQLRLEQIQREFDSAQSEELLLQRIHAAKTGKDGVPEVGLQKAWELWTQLPRKKRLKHRVKVQMKSLWGKWTGHVRSKQPAAKNLSDVSPASAESFMTAEEARGLSPKSYNNVLSALRGVFNLLKRHASIYVNPFEHIPEQDSCMIGRLPFSVDELAAILRAAESPQHELVRDVVKTGICTAMRLGDCCTLRWDAIDLKAGFIRVKTSKNGETAEIPIFPLLEQAVHASLPRRDIYVFPEAAKMYLANADGVRYRVQRLFADAGFFDSDLHPERTDHRGDIHQDREVGLRRACLRGFHSFRVTWVTLALNAGVPIGLVQRVTSHKTVEVVDKHYFKPNRENFRRALEEKLPHLSTLAGIAVTDPLEQLLARFKAEIQPLTSEQRRRLRQGVVSLCEGESEASCKHQKPAA